MSSLFLNTAAMAGGSIETLVEVLGNLHKGQLNIISSIERNTDALRKINDRLTNLETAVEKERLERNAEMTVLRSEISSLSQASILADPCELKIDGIPQALNIDLAIQKTFEALGFPNLMHHVIETRNWTRPSCTPDSQPPASKESSATRSVVVKLASPTVRDTVLARSAKVQNVDAQRIYDTGGKSKINLSALWPKSLYLLLKEASNVSKSLNYARPVIRNMRVCMRKKLQGPFVPVFNSQDLLSLPQRIHNQEQ